MKSFLLLVVITTTIGFFFRDYIAAQIAQTGQFIENMSQIPANDHYGMKWFAIAIVLSALIKMISKMIPSVITHKKK